MLWLRAVRRDLPRAGLGEARNVRWPDLDPFETVAQSERAQLAARAFAGFTERERVFAALCFGQGLDPREIADSMKISVKTVYSKEHKIMAKLEAVVAAIKEEEVAA